ncbi:hypothetical protein BBK14_23560 [Parafrankia soli]|uniref:Uncharacterized protein n=1 Tax=Parafrankia soli TaxID=2599596 RepID=A0A1S1PRS3_9ACTN|nr:hypothetical protein [Parafrankia soli]OHV23961.1 hypothetical protein BBK14_23560 [Parafrankia soli]
MGHPTAPTPDPSPQAGIPAPPGARILTPDEAAHLIVTGDHPAGGKGSLEIDAALITLVRDGRVRVAQFPDGTLAFAVVPDTA